MTVKELKEQLKDVPDTASVAVWLTEQGVEYKYTGRYSIDSVDLDAIGDPEDEGYTIDLNIHIPAEPINNTNSDCMNEQDKLNAWDDKNLFDRTCPKCGSYRIMENGQRGRMPITSLRCKDCGHIWKIN